jgi:hypothetical protein
VVYNLAVMELKRGNFRHASELALEAETRFPENRILYALSISRDQTLSPQARYKALLIEKINQPQYIYYLGLAKWDAGKFQEAYDILASQFGRLEKLGEEEPQYAALTVRSAELAGLKVSGLMEYFSQALSPAGFLSFQDLLKELRGQEPMRNGKP